MRHRNFAVSAVLVYGLLVSDTALASFIGPSVKHGPSGFETVILNYKLEDTCFQNTGCTWNFSIPLSATDGFVTHNYPDARAYLSGWHYSSIPASGAWKTQSLEVGVSAQSLRQVGGTTFLDITLVFAALSTPHDGDEVAIDIEVLATKRATTEVEFVSLTHTDVGLDVVTMNKTANSNLDFAAAPISYFKIETNTATSGPPIGANFKELVVDAQTLVVPGGVESNVVCKIIGDHLPSSTVSTGCTVERQFVFAKAALIERATTQPFIQLAIPIVPSPSPYLDIIGGAGPTGAPMCGLGSFFFEKSGPLSSLKLRELGVRLPDCDYKLLSRGTPVQFWLDGRFCWEKWSGSRISSQQPVMAYFPYYYPTEGCTDEASGTPVFQGLTPVGGTGGQDQREWKGRIDLESAAVK